MAAMMFEPWEIMGTMLGDAGFEVEIGETAKPIDKVFAKGGKMINDRQQRPHNTTISSIIVLETYLPRLDLIRINIKQNEERFGRRFFHGRDLGYRGSRSRFESS